MSDFDPNLEPDPYDDDDDEEVTSHEDDGESYTDEEA